MKKIAILTTITAFVLTTVALTFWYDLSDRDYDLLDAVEERILDIVDETDWLEIEHVIDLVETMQEKRSMSERSEEIIETLIADLYWYAWYEDEEGDEYYALTQEDCYDDEYFHEGDEDCYLIEDEDYEDEEDDDDFDYGYDEKFDEHTHWHDNDSDHEEEEIIARYDVTNNWLVFVSWNDDQSYRDAWSAFSALFPQRRIDFIDTATFFDSDENDTAAYVERVNNDGSKWLIAFNMSSIREGDNEELYVHEMGHIITLDQTQIATSTPDWADDEIYERHEEKCTTHYVFEWCLASSSYFYAFVAKFWTEKMLEMVEDEKDLYKKYSDEFVTDYAATNPGEDLAETFAYFVTKPKLHGIWWIAWEKIDFLYGFPELVTLRSYIRERLPR